MLREELGSNFRMQTDIFHMIVQLITTNVTLVEIGECNTSQRCCRCHEKMKNARKVVDGDGIHQELIHAVKVCPHCCTTWNRDLNASRNIAHIFNMLRSGEERPEALQKLPESDVYLHNSLHCCDHGTLHKREQCCCICSLGPASGFLNSCLPHLCEPERALPQFCHLRQYYSDYHI